MDKFLKGHNDLEGTQAVIGYKFIFRGFIANDWFGVSNSDNRYAKLNRIIVYEAVHHYCSNWRARNTRRNCPVARRERILQWAKEEYQSLENYKTTHLAKYMANYERVIILDTDSIKRWLISLHTLRKSNV